MTAIDKINATQANRKALREQQQEKSMSSIKKRELLSHGFIAFTGQKWADCQVDSYNAIQCSINQFIQHNMQIPDYLLKGSHNLFYSYSYA